MCEPRSSWPWAGSGRTRQPPFPTWSACSETRASGSAGKRLAALGRIGTAAADPLIAATAHQDVIIRAGAVEGLGYLPRHRMIRSIEPCSDGAHDAAPEVRAAA